MSLKQTIENHQVVFFFTTIITGFLAGLATNQFFIEKNDSFISKSEVQTSFIRKIDCEKTINTYFILGEDTAYQITPSDKNKINTKIVDIEKLVTPLDEIDSKVLSDEMQEAFLLGELDILFGQMKVIKSVLDGKNIKNLNDSISSKFEYKYNSLIKNNN